MGGKRRAAPQRQSLLTRALWLVASLLLCIQVIFRKVAVPRNLRRLGLTAVTVMAFAATGLSAPVTSTARFTDGSTNASNVVSSGVLAPPTNVVITDGSPMTLNWSASVSTKATGYKIYRSATTGVLGGLVATVTPRTTTTWVDNNPLAGTNYYVIKTYLSNWESGFTESIGVGVVTVTDNFNGSGALGTSEVGGKVWQEINGTWSRGGGNASTATAATSNPMAVVDVGSGNIDISTTVTGQSGEAIYFRVVDGDDWQRARYRRNLETSYYTEYQHPIYSTEYQHPSYSTEYQHPTYATEMQISRQYRQNEGWGAWVFQSQTACRISEPSLPATTNDAWGYQYTAYRYTPGGTVNCTGSQIHYNLEKATATTTFSAVTYPWVDSGFAMTYGRYTRESDTGNRRQGAQNGSYWDFNSGGTVLSTRQTQTGSYWDFNSGGTVLSTRQTQTGSYWDTNSGGTVLATRQGSTNYFSYDLVLDKSVAGAVTALQTFSNIGTISAFRVVASGSSITTYTDSTARAAITDTSHQNATRHGIGLSGATHSATNYLTYVTMTTI